MRNTSSSQPWWKLCSLPSPPCRPSTSSVTMTSLQGASRIRGRPSTGSVGRPCCARTVAWSGGGAKQGDARLAWTLSRAPGAGLADWPGSGCGQLLQLAALGSRGGLRTKQQQQTRRQRVAVRGRDVQRPEKLLLRQVRVGAVEQQQLQRRQVVATERRVDGTDLLGISCPCIHLCAPLKQESGHGGVAEIHGQTQRCESVRCA